MKKILLFVFAMLFSSATMLADDILNRVHPNEASYKIEGNFHYRVIDNKVSYELTNVVPTGLSFKKQDVYYGSQPEGKEVMFTFEKVVTEPGFPGFDNISYWYYDPDIADWQPDVEIKKGEQNSQLNKDVTMMLIIDCSSSLKNDFNVVKEATCNFLDLMYKTAPNGNLHIGIIGFSSIPDTQTFPIKPLDGASYNEMRNFIRNLRSSNGTALFYAWDKAMEQTYSYINSGRMRQYTTSHFVTFTDGIDQTSQDINHLPSPIVNADDYYNYIIATAKNKISNYESDVVFVKGVDITNAQQQEKFENKLRQLAVPNNDIHYERLESVSRLNNKFSEIAKRLTEQWKTLNCYVAPARHGRVCWTFGKKDYKQPEPPRVEKPRTGRNIFLGFNATFGVPLKFAKSNNAMTYTTNPYASYDGWFDYDDWNDYDWNSSSNNTYSYSNDDYYNEFDAVYPFGIGGNVKFGVDFAYPVSDRFGIGFYTAIGGGIMCYIPKEKVFDNDLRWTFDLKFGLLMLMGDVNERPFILGLAPCTGFMKISSISYSEAPDFMCVPLEIRLGRVIKEHLYVTGNIMAGIPVKGKFILEPGFSIGYHFGNRLKKK